MTSILVIRQNDDTASIGAAALKNADGLAAALTERLSAHNQQAQPPQMDWKAILLDLGQFLVDSGESLVEKDLELQQQRHVENQLRFDRDEASLQIRAQLRSLRFLLDEAFGKEKARRMLPTRTDLQRINAKVLLGVAQEAANLLRNPAYTWPDLSGLPHLANPAQILASLEVAIPKLRAAVSELRPEQRGAQHALGKKNRELESTIEAMQRGADFIYGLFRLAGFDDEADRLRPRRRRAKASTEETPPAAPQMPEVRPSIGFLPPATP